MTLAAEKTIRRLGLSGLHGFDFMLEANTGNAYLIEINARTTQVGHLTLGSGRDLPAALYSAVSNEALRLIAAYHDVPWQESELVRTCIQIRPKRKSWYLESDWTQMFSTVRAPRQ
jgi:biotin carboxylase